MMRSVAWESIIPSGTAKGSPLHHHSHQPPEEPYRTLHRPWQCRCRQQRGKGRHSYCPPTKASSPVSGFSRRTCSSLPAGISPQNTPVHPQLKPHFRSGGRRIPRQHDQVGNAQFPQFPHRTLRSRLDAVRQAEASQKYAVQRRINGHAMVFSLLRPYAGLLKKRLFPTRTGLPSTRAETPPPVTSTSSATRSGNRVPSYAFTMERPSGWEAESSAWAAQYSSSSGETPSRGSTSSTEKRLPSRFRFCQTPPSSPSAGHPDSCSLSAKSLPRRSPYSGKKPSGMDSTSAQGQEITSRTRARNRPSAQLPPVTRG